LPTWPSSADDRALLIGVSRFAQLDQALPGIDIDIELVKRGFERLGLDDTQMRLIEDDEATLARIRAAIQGWATLNLKSTDRVFIYFTGYGSQVADTDGDEQDGLDEVLLPYDAELEPQPRNVLTDDDLAALVALVPSENIYIVLDAAYRPTSVQRVTLANKRLGVDHALSKCMPILASREATNEGFMPDKGGEAKYFELLASDGTLPSLATDQGSVFTLGLADAIESAFVDQHAVTMQWLTEKTEGYVAMHLDAAEAFRPHSTHNERLLKASHAVVSTGAGKGPVWRQYEALVTKSSPMKLTGPRNRMGIGDELELSLELPTEGYLNVISIDSEDQATILFPNKYHLDNRVRAGRMRLPTDEMGFAIEAQPPTGPSLVAAILTRTPINSYELTVAGRDESGGIIRVFAPVSARATRGFAAVSREAVNHPSSTAPAMYGAALTFEILPGEPQAH
jgi:hypothetical protein